jgi:hypothetical protein
MSEQVQEFEVPKAVEIVKPAPSAALTPIELVRMAVSQNADVDKLQKLLELQERWEANQARKAFEIAFAAFKAEAPRLEKTKTVDFPGKSGGRVNYKYTPLDVVANTLGPVLAKHGLSYNWKQEPALEGNIRVICILKHFQGHSETNTLEGPPETSGTKNPLQSIGSTVSLLRRYTLLGALGMATSDEDTDGVTMGEAADFIAHIQEAADMEELEKRYKEAIKTALSAQSPKAVKVYMEARKKRQQELTAA